MLFGIFTWDTGSYYSRSVFSFPSAEPRAGFKLTTLVAKVTVCIDSC